MSREPSEQSDAETCWSSPGYSPTSPAGTPRSEIDEVLGPYEEEGLFLGSFITDNGAVPADNPENIPDDVFNMLCDDVSPNLDPACHGEEEDDWSALLASPVAIPELIFRSDESGSTSVVLGSGHIELPPEQQEAADPGHRGSASASGSGA